MFFRKHLAVTVVICLCLGFFMGSFLHSRVANHRIHRAVFDLSDTELLSDTLVDFTTGQWINILDALAKKDRNLLVFWSPMCSFSKKFFLHQLNEQVVGIFCFPLATDLEYLNFYIDKHNIQLPQLMVQRSEKLLPVDVSSIEATPTFVIVNDKGERLNQYIGINELDEMLTFLYQGIQ